MNDELNSNAASGYRRRTRKEMEDADGVLAERRLEAARQVRGMKKVLGGSEGVLGMLGAERREAGLATLQATDHTWGKGDRPPSVGLETEREAILEVAGGASVTAVEVRYDLHAGYVQHALARRFGSPEAAKTALRGMVLENALACQVVAATQIHEMTGVQAVAAGAILIDKALLLERSIAEQPKTIDFAALADMSKTLSVLREIASGVEPKKPS